MCSCLVQHTSSVQHNTFSELDFSDTLWVLVSSSDDIFTESEGPLETRLLRLNLYYKCLCRSLQCPYLSQRPFLPFSSAGSHLNQLLQISHSCPSLKVFTVWIQSLLIVLSHTQRKSLVLYPYYCCTRTLIPELSSLHLTLTLNPSLSVWSIVHLDLQNETLRRNFCVKETNFFIDVSNV